MRNLILSLVVLAILSACGGGGGSDGETVVDQKVGGIYTGTIASEVTGASSDVLAIISEDGYAALWQLSLAPPPWFFFITDQIKPVGTAFSTGLMGAGALGSIFEDGTQTATGTFSGTITEREFIDGRYTLGNDKGTVGLTYNKVLHQSGSSFSTVQGTYESFRIPAPGGPGDFYVGNLTVGSDGTVAGSEYLGPLGPYGSSGCALHGSLSIPDSRFNVYKLTLDTTCAETATRLAGLGISLPATVDAPQVIEFFVGDESSSAALVLFKTP